MDVRKDNGDAPTARRRVRRRSVRLAAGALGGLAALLLLEAGLRIFPVPFIYFAMTETPLQLGAAAPHPTIQYTNRPGYAGRFDTREFRSAIRINSKGLRDREHSYEKPARTKRILVLGDSMVYGWGVDVEETVPDLLERRLPGSEVLNAGCPGWGTRHQAEFLKLEGVRYDPDGVLLFFSTNDPDDNVTRLKFIGDNLALAEAPEGTAGKVKRFLTRNLATYTLFARAKAEVLGALRREPAVESDPDGLWEQEERHLDDVRRFCESRKLPLAVVYIPDRTPLHQRWGPRVKAYCAREDVPLLDLAPVLDAAEHQAPIVFQLDYHWTPHGHRAVAEATHRFLDELRWTSAGSGADRK